MKFFGRRKQLDKRLVALEDAVQGVSIDVSTLKGAVAALKEAVATLKLVVDAESLLREWDVPRQARTRRKARKSKGK